MKSQTNNTVLPQSLNSTVKHARVGSIGDYENDTLLYKPTKTE